MEIPPLGKLERHDRFADWLESSEVEVPYFDGARLGFVLEAFEADPAPDDFVSAIASFLRLTVDDRALATPYVFQNYLDFMEIAGEDDDVVIASADGVWSHVHPTRVHVSRRTKGDRRVYVQVSADCEWEDEHGLQLVFRDGSTLSRVSPRDGHLTHAEAYGLPESEDRIA